MFIEQARVLILGKYVLLGDINTIIKIVTLESFYEMQIKDQFFGPWALYLRFGICYEVNISQLSSFCIHK